MSRKTILWNFPGGPAVKTLPSSAGDTGDWGSIPGSGRSPGEGNGSPLQSSCLENPMDGGAWGRRQLYTTEPTHTVINLNVLLSCPTEFSCTFSPFYQTVTHTNKPPEGGQTSQKFPGAANKSVTVPSFPGNPKAHLGVSQLRMGRQAEPSVCPTLLPPLTAWPCCPPQAPEPALSIPCPCLTHKPL